VPKTSPPAFPAPPRGPLAVQRVPHATLVPHQANARTHPKANLDAIVASLRRWGQAEPLVVRIGTRRVVAGHGRLAAAGRERGLTARDFLKDHGIAEA